MNRRKRAGQKIEPNGTPLVTETNQGMPHVSIHLACCHKDDTGTDTDPAFVINDGDIYRLWSYNSAVSGGRFVSITDDPEGRKVRFRGAKKYRGSDDENEYVVAATQDEQPSTKIKFVENANPPPVNFELHFLKNDNWYALNASESSATATKIPNHDAAQFRYLELDPPNKPYVVFQCTNQKIGGHEWYLSSNAAGNLKLKRWNLAGENLQPPKADESIDPALLFRVVKPFPNEK